MLQLLSARLAFVLALTCFSSVAMAADPVVTVTRASAYTWDGVPLSRLKYTVNGISAFLVLDMELMATVAPSKTVFTTYFGGEPVVILDDEPDGSYNSHTLTLLANRVPSIPANAWVYGSDSNIVNEINTMEVMLGAFFTRIKAFNGADAAMIESDATLREGDLVASRSDDGEVLNSAVIVKRKNASGATVNRLRSKYGFHYRYETTPVGEEKAFHPYGLRTMTIYRRNPAR